RGLASTPPHQLTSSFRPSYNMAVNLVANYKRPEAEHLLASSFAQFLADRTVVGSERTLARKAEFLDGYRQAARGRGEPARGAGPAQPHPVGRRSRPRAARRERGPGPGWPAARARGGAR